MQRTIDESDFMMLYYVILLLFKCYGVIFDYKFNVSLCNMIHGAPDALIHTV